MEIIKFVKVQYLDKVAVQKVIDNFLEPKPSYSYIGSDSASVWNFTDEMYAVKRYFNKGDNHSLIHIIIESEDFQYFYNYDYIDGEEAAWHTAFSFASYFGERHQVIFRTCFAERDELSSAQIHMIVNPISFVDGTEIMQGSIVEDEFKKFIHNMISIKKSVAFHI